MLAAMSQSEFVQGSRPAGKTARRLQRLVLERRYGMPRGALRDLDLIDLGFGAGGRVREYVPSPWDILRRILSADEVTPEDVFIDIGCGMGPVLVEAAAHYSFRRVIGIDLVPEFTEVARATIASGRQRFRCLEIEVVTGDIIEYEMSDDVTVVFMFDPVRASLFDAIVAKLIASVDRNPRRLRLIYYCPVETGRLERTGRARLVRYGRRRNRPWSTTPDLAMFEIDASGLEVWSSPRPSPGLPQPLPRRLLPRRPVNGNNSSRPDAEHQQADNTTIQLTSTESSHGVRVASVGSPEDLRSLRASFKQQHCARLSRFLSRPLLHRIQRYVEEGTFAAHPYGGISTELCIDAGKAPELMFLLLNDPHLFALVQRITGCGRIGRIDGGVRRVMPGLAQQEPWHGEIFGHGQVEISIDLSERPYSGGMLETRDRDHAVLYGRIDTEPGDAVLVRLAPFVQHRLTAVRSDSPRTAYVGRFTLFKSGSDSKLARSRIRV